MQSILRSQYSRDRYRFGAYEISFNPFKSGGFFYRNTLDRSVSIAGCLVSFYYHYVLQKVLQIEETVIRSSDLGLYCFVYYVFFFWALNTKMG